MTFIIVGIKKNTWKISSQENRHHLQKRLLHVGEKNILKKKNGILESHMVFLNPIQKHLKNQKLHSLLQLFKSVGIATGYVVNNETQEYNYIVSHEQGIHRTQSSSVRE